MWALDNQTPYGADRAWIRDKTGTHQWLVAVKATFDIGEQGRLRLSDEQPPPSREPQHRGDPATTSLRLDSDLLAAKPATDVILDAYAHAPRGKPRHTVEVSLRIAEVHKTLLVHGPRVYVQGAWGLTTSRPLPFTRLPVHYEWAYGGSDLTPADLRKRVIDARNPVGKGIRAVKSQLENQPAHLIEYPRGKFAEAGPAGFGPIASAWSPRRERAGTYDSRWEATKKPLLADNYSELAALSSPDDQRPRKPLRGGETILLTNMTPSGELKFDLPRIVLTFQTKFGHRPVEHRGTMVTVFVVPDELKLSVVWQSLLPVSVRDADYLDFTTIREKPYVG